MTQWQPSRSLGLMALDGRQPDGANSKRIFWYLDRKVFGLGRYITDEMLAGMAVPA